MNTKTYQVEAVDEKWYQRSVKCFYACPLHINAGKYASLISEGQYAKALRVIREKLPFPGILGEVCYHPCELQCKKLEKGESPIHLCALKRFVAEREEESALDLSISEEREEKVAVIGGGPAGVLAAYDLRKMGFKAVLFEAKECLGGLLMDGIPSYRLSRELIAKELGILEKIGVEIRLKSRVGVDISLKELKEGFRAVFISVGDAAAQEIALVGEELTFTLTKRGTFKVDPLTLKTSVEGFFAGGDSVRGPSTVIDAMAEGRRAALSIERYIKGEDLASDRGDGFIPRAVREIALGPVSVQEGEGVPDLLEPIGPLLSEEEAQEEGGRCLKCFVTPVFDSEKCILCGACVDVCPGYCLKMVRLESLEGDKRVDEVVKDVFGFTLKTFKEDSRDEREGIAIIKDDDRCVHCKLCEIRCPTGAIITELF